MKKWEKEFNKRFRPKFKTKLFSEFNLKKMDYRVNIIGSIKEIKQFIQDLLDEKYN